MDAANVDLKSFDEEFYHRITAGHLAPVLETLEYLVRETKVWVEITTLLIPGHNDSDGEIDALTRWVVDRLGPDVPLHFTAFHPDWKMRDVAPTPPATLARGPCHRPTERRPARLHRQRARPRRRQHLVPRLRAAARRPRLVRDRRLPADRRRSLRALRHALPRPLRRSARRLGRAPPAGASRRRRAAAVSPRIRPAAVAGAFYPAEPDLLAELVDRLVRAGRTEGPPPKAVIAPHAGYAYSGPVAGSAYARVSALRDRVERVVVMGPAHNVRLSGLAVSGADAFATPLGAVAVDGALRRRALDLPGVLVSDSAHADEHALEVQLPFLQRVLGAIRISRCSWATRTPTRSPACWTRCGAGPRPSS